MASVAMGGAWMIEQPRSSLVIWHPRIRLLWRLLPKAGVSSKRKFVHNKSHRDPGNWNHKWNHHYVLIFLGCMGALWEYISRICWLYICNIIPPWVEVYEAKWWAGMYGAMTWKRHIAWSSSPTIQCLDLGTLCLKMKKLIKRYGVKSTRKHRTKRGQARFSGSKELRATGPLGH